jgi:hypothetical protein
LELLSSFNLHLPDEVRIFTIPEEGVLLWNDAAQVYEVGGEEGMVLRHYSFYHRWFEVNVSLDSMGRFITEPGPIDWTFNIDICTPCFSIGPNLYNVDLCLDVLAGPDGVSYVVTDEDQFAEEVAAGWITETEAAGAREGLRRLLGIIEEGSLISFLDALVPFEIKRRNVPPSSMKKVSLSEAPVLSLPERAAHFGRRYSSEAEIRRLNPP